MSSSKSYLEFSMNHNPFSFPITRNSTGENIFDATAHPIGFLSQYLSICTKLPEPLNIYGLGESFDPFRLKTSNYSKTLWSRDAYGTPELTTCTAITPYILTTVGKTPSMYLEYRTRVGVVDLYFLGRPNPKEVAMQYPQRVGLPAMMSYWHFGFHNCRYGYYDIYKIAEVIANYYSAANIPLETQWTGIDYMNLRRVFTPDPYQFPFDKTRDLVPHLHKSNQHHMVMVDPAVT
ncbi:hypothetical protein PMG11_05260 [Penicillium brasilianum]|uniref:Glycoside hydrolase family 31 TIM barrel domain-containing protein n=1 Tax=Penicillium brasilianum TaxID=104259 RepID=A0A0F7VF60_PENBI|nr:hypothetical protein PMG11_05260 [Penicillium brasilianum]